MTDRHGIDPTGRGHTAIPAADPAGPPSGGAAGRGVPAVELLRYADRHLTSGLSMEINRRVTVSKAVSDDGRSVRREVAFPAHLLPANLRTMYTRLSMVEFRLRGVFCAAMANRHAAWAAMVPIPFGHRWRTSSTDLPVDLKADPKTDGRRLIMRDYCLFEVSDNAFLIHGPGPEHAVVCRPIYDHVDPDVFLRFATSRAARLAGLVAASWSS